MRLTQTPSVLDSGGEAKQGGSGWCRDVGYEFNRFGAQPNSFSFCLLGASLNTGTNQGPLQWEHPQVLPGQGDGFWHWDSSQKAPRNVGLDPRSSPRWVEGWKPPAWRGRGHNL